MATLGSWGTYYYRTNTNTPSPDGDWLWYFVISYSQNINANTSTVTIDSYIQFANQPSDARSRSWIYQNYINGTMYGNTMPTGYNQYPDDWVVYKPPAGNSTKYIGTETGTIHHNDDGTAQLVFSAKGGYWGNASGVPYYEMKTCSHTYTLPTINRQSTVTNTTSENSRIDLGSNVTFTVTAPNSNITNILSYTVNGNTTTIGTVTGNGTITHTFQPSIADEFISTSTPNIIVDVTSSNGTRSSTTVYLNIPDTSEYLPTVTATLSDAWGSGSAVMKPPQFDGLFVQGYSQANMGFTVSFKHGATYASSLAYKLTSVNGNEYYISPTSASLGNVETVTGVGSKTFTIQVTDSRGKVVTVTSNTIVSYEYHKPQLAARIERCDSSGTLDNDGTYAKITVTSWDISPVNNTNTHFVYCEENGTPHLINKSAYSGTNASVIIGGSLSTTNATTVNVFATDLLNDYELILTLPPSFVTLSLRAGGKGVSLGQIATQDGFHDYMNAQFHGELKDSGGNNIGSPNNGKLTIQKNGTTVKTFTANQSSNVTANITVPTKTSDLINDSGFTGLTVTQIRNSTAYGDGSHTYTNGADDYKFYIFVAKVYASNAGYNTAILPADLVNNGIQVVVSDEVNFVRSYLRKSGTDLVYEDYARNGNGYIQYIYGVK